MDGDNTIRSLPDAPPALPARVNGSSSSCERDTLFYPGTDVPKIDPLNCPPCPEYVPSLYELEILLGEWIEMASFYATRAYAGREADETRLRVICARAEQIAERLGEPIRRYWVRRTWSRLLRNVEEYSRERFLDYCYMWLQAGYPFFTVVFDGALDEMPGSPEHAPTPESHSVNPEMESEGAA